MAEIEVYRPDSQETHPPADLAPRRGFPANATIVLVENGKPTAKELLRYIGEEIQALHPDARLVEHSKRSASSIISDAEVARFSAGAHFVIAGLGD